MEMYVLRPSEDHYSLVCATINFKSVFENFLEKFDKGSENFENSSIKLGKYSI